jgi:hypothetical protein
MSRVVMTVTASPREMRPDRDGGRSMLRDNALSRAALQAAGNSGLVLFRGVFFRDSGLGVGWVDRGAIVCFSQLLWVAWVGYDP